MNKNVLICLNKLDIGGVETVVVNQTIELIERGYRVVILAQKGIYTDMLIKKGAICIEFDFELKDGYDLKRAKEIENIIYKYDIGQAHIHQLDCIISAFPACLITNTPYVAYVHTGIMGVYSWFEEHYSDYNGMFNMYFNTAEKLVAITEESKIENMENYKVPEEKYVVINNSIRFDEELIKDITPPEKIEKFLIVSRLAEEKLISIKNAIEIFRNYHKENSNSTLTIIGDGKCTDSVKKEIQDLKGCVQFLGARNDVINIMKDYDVVIALDRCILESIATKRISIVSGYEKIGGIITDKNIKEAASSNFSGRKLKEVTIDEIVDDLKKLTKEQISKIVEKNYEFAYNNLNIKNNIYMINCEEKRDLQINKKLYLEEEKKLTDKITEEKNKTERIYKECKEAQAYFEKQIENLQKENKRLNEIIQNNEKNMIELEKIKNSRSWKYSRKVVDIFKHKKNSSKD